MQLGAFAPLRSLLATKVTKITNRSSCCIEASIASYLFDELLSSNKRGIGFQPLPACDLKSTGWKPKPLISRTVLNRGLDLGIEQSEDGFVRFPVLHRPWRIDRRLLRSVPKILVGPNESTRGLAFQVDRGPVGFA